jgi:hypothetical protein
MQTLSQLRVSTLMSAIWLLCSIVLFYGQSLLLLSHSPAHILVILFFQRLSYTRLRHNVWILKRILHVLKADALRDKLFTTGSVNRVLSYNITPLYCMIVLLIVIIMLKQIHHKCQRMCSSLLLFLDSLCYPVSTEDSQPQWIAHILLPLAVKNSVNSKLFCVTADEKQPAITDQTTLNNGVRSPDISCHRHGQLLA